VNYLRNVALRQANTQHVFLLDVDFLPMLNLYNYSRQLLESASSIASMLGIAAHDKLVSVPSIDSLIIALTGDDAFIVFLLTSTYLLYIELGDT